MRSPTKFVVAFMVLSCSFLGATCKSEPSPAPPPPGPIPVPSALASCSTAPLAPGVSTAAMQSQIQTICCQARLHACELGKPTPKGASCEDVLAITACQMSGQAACVDLDCMAKALAVDSGTACKAADGCGR
jgi:hypothetical protein